MLRIPHISRKWKWPRVLIVLMVLELGGTVAALALFGIAQPNLFRTALWQVGSDNGFNSSPLQILYAYANYRPIPTTPFVWSQALTDYNVTVSVLSMFILLVKVIMFSLHIWYPLLSTVSNAVIVGLWTASVYGQAGPDHSDPSHPSNVAWYLTHSCDVAKASGNEHYCIMAKGTFATTVLMLSIFFFNLILGIWSMIPSAHERAVENVDIDEMQMKGGNGSDTNLEMKPHPRTNTVPYTPRTLAFNTLDRQLPLRSDTYKAPPRFT